ncbi:MAG: DNA polymerase III subunit delta' [Spirochaetota bacterium]|nr:DNA polymerase III subunit delta' [Thermodesulfobacteriota bacterium]MDY6967709.1 DNA polymerase III subunit delta' [Spirochaetota bacterium]
MSFRDVIGHSKQLEQLTRMLRNRKIAHSYLFAGLEGIGKRCVAKEFAKALNCQEKSEDACDNCISCKKIEKGTFLDVHVLKPDGNQIKVDQVRNLQREFLYALHEGYYRVIIIDDAQKLNIQASNAFLKILEEPPVSTVIILISDSVYSLLPTVISRCQIVKFNSLGHEDVVKILVEKLGIDRERAMNVAVFSMGSAKRALTMSEDVSIMNFQKNLSRLVTLKLNDLDTIISKAEELSRCGESLKEKLNILKMFYRDVSLKKQGIEHTKGYNKDYVKEIEGFSETLPLPDILERIFKVESAQRDLEGNVNKQILVENLLIRLAVS